MNNSPIHTPPVGIAQGEKCDTWQRSISYFEMSTEEAVNFTSHGIIPPNPDYKGRAKGSKYKRKVV